MDVEKVKNWIEAKAKQDNENVHLHTFGLLRVRLLILIKVYEYRIEKGCFLTGAPTGTCAVFAQKDATGLYRSDSPIIADGNVREIIGDSSEWTAAEGIDVIWIVRRR